MPTGAAGCSRAATIRRTAYYRRHENKWPESARSIAELKGWGPVTADQQDDITLIAVDVL